MLVNEAPRGPEAEESSFDAVMQGLQRHTEFPITDLRELQAMTDRYGQKPTYRALVATYGREQTEERLSGVTNPDVVRFQLDVLTGTRPLEDVQ